VYENKVVLFLNDRVLGREIRASRYTKARTTADSVPVRQTLGSVTWRRISCDDFRIQRRLQGNLPPNLAGGAAAFGGILPSMPTRYLGSKTPTFSPLPGGDTSKLARLPRRVI